MTKHIFLFGRSGKMGASVSEMLKGHAHLKLVDEASKADVFLDFSVSKALEGNLSCALNLGKPIVIGTTGHSKDGFSKMHEASCLIPLFYAPNFSLGIAFLIQALKTLHPQLSGHAIEIEETHPVHKKDAPSGTARLLASLLNVEPDTIVSHRKGVFSFSHTVSVAFDEETLTFSHEATSRSVFAKGALTAVQFLLSQPPGLYSMEEMLSCLKM